jgi:hypothetical protein
METTIYYLIEEKKCIDSITIFVFDKNDWFIPADTSFCSPSSITIGPANINGNYYRWSLGEITKDVDVKKVGNFICQLHLVNLPLLKVLTLKHVIQIYLHQMLLLLLLVELIILFE